MSRGTWQSGVGPSVFVLLALQPVLAQEHLPAPAVAPPAAAPVSTALSQAVCDSCAPCKDWLFGGGFWVDGSFLYLQPRRRAQDFAIVDPNTAGTAVGDVRSVDWTSNAGYQVGAGYRIGGAVEQGFEGGAGRRVLLHLLQSLPYSEELGEAHLDIAFLYRWEKQLEEAWQWLQDLEAQARRDHDLRTLGSLSLHRGAIRQSAGDLRGAIPYFEYGLELH